jgi:hypothetical protein
MLLEETLREIKMSIQQVRGKKEAEKVELHMVLQELN